MTRLSFDSLKEINVKVQRYFDDLTREIIRATRGGIVKRSLTASRVDRYLTKFQYLSTRSSVCHKHVKDGRLIKSQLWSFRSIQCAYSGSQLLIVAHCRKILVSRYNDHVPRSRGVQTAGQSRSSVIG